jgi:Ca2+-binding RTX toxin-like protein
MPVTVTPTASPSPSNGRFTTLTANLSGDPVVNPSFTWSIVVKPAATPDPTYSDNNDASAQNTTATVTRAGNYTFQIDVYDGITHVANGTVTVTFNQVFSWMALSPGSVVLANNGFQKFIPNTLDQFLHNMATQPTQFFWTCFGVGSIDSNGKYTAPATGGGQATITVTYQGISRSSSVAINDTTSPGVFYSGIGSKIITVRCNDYNNYASVSLFTPSGQPTLVLVQLTSTNQAGQTTLTGSQQQPLTGVVQVVFDGHLATNCSFTNNSAVPCDATGGSGTNTLTGGSGNDTLRGGAAPTSSNVMHGNAGDDTLIGGGGTNYMYGGPGNNTLIPGPAGSTNYLFPNG